MKVKHTKKFTKAVLLHLVAIALALVAWVYPITTIAATLKNNDVTSTPPPQINTPVQPSPDPPPEAPRNEPTPKKRVQSGWHPIKAEVTVSEITLQTWLQDRASPLAPYAADILASPHWSTIIGICWIEQYHCTKAPHNNYWGLGPGKRYATLPEGILAISNFLANAEAKHPTIESMRGWYCASACTNWESTVIKIKIELENLQP